MAGEFRPGVEQTFTQRTPRVVAARKLLTRKARDEHGLFLAEGPQCVREAAGAASIEELFVTHEARQRYGEIMATVEAAGARVSMVTTDALVSLTQTHTPQGMVAVCRHRDIPLTDAVAHRLALVAVLVDVGDPGNAGTVTRTADAAGASTVIFAGHSVDPYNGKCVRASAGSIFHVDLVRADKPWDVVDTLRSHHIRLLATDPRGKEDLYQFAARGGLASPTAWLFGSEAHGLSEDLLASADARIRVPIHGQAESLNLAAAAAVCLYASARERSAVSDDRGPSMSSGPWPDHTV